jgi:hypothetical protein
LEISPELARQTVLALQPQQVQVCTPAPGPDDDCAAPPRELRSQ